MTSDRYLFSDYSKWEESCVCHLTVIARSQEGCQDQHLIARNRKLTFILYEMQSQKIYCGHFSVIILIDVHFSYIFIKSYFIPKLHVFYWGHTVFKGLSYERRL